VGQQQAVRCDGAAQHRTISRRSRRLFQIGPWHPQSSAGDRPDLDAAVYRRGRRAERLDAILFESFDDLRAARAAEDRRIVDFVDGLDDGRIAGTIKYRRVSSPEEFEQQLAPALAHWFNHQTHHRGHVHALLTGLVGEAPELDLLIFQRQSVKSAA